MRHIFSDQHGQEIGLLRPLGRVKLFSAVYIEGRVKVTSKGKVSNFLNVGKKVYQIQLQLCRNPMVPLILLCDVERAQIYI